METSENYLLRVAILDLNAGITNQSMRCLREILNTFADQNGFDLQLDEFEVRIKNQVPDTSYDIYISSGGPGSPLESIGSEWEAHYFGWLNTMEQWNADPLNVQKKQVFFICHSFQLVCRHYNLGNVTNRKSTSFGVFPIHLLQDGEQEAIFEGLNDPFYVVDSRNFQVITPNHENIEKMGAQILCIEKERPHVPYERAVMAVRFNDYFFGTQFHPEADAVGMGLHLQTPDRKKIVIETYGEPKWQSMVEQLQDPDKIMSTYNHIFPNFLRIAVGNMVTVEA